MNHWLVACMLSFSLIACTTSGIEGRVQGGSPDNPVFTQQLIVHSDSLARKIVIAEIRSHFVADLLAATVVLQNKSSRDQSFQYRFSWFDQQGIELEQGADNWTPLVLHGQQSSSLQAIAPNPQARSYKINIRKL